MDASVTVAEVPASRGARWLSEAFRMFRGQALVWVALCAGWVFITVGLLLVPIIGIVASNFLQPVFFASFAVAAHKQRVGERITVNDLFTGFRHHVRELINLGAVLLLAQLAVLVLMAVLGLPTTGNSEHDYSMQEYAELLEGREWILAIGLLLTAIVKGALWFAPPLIAFHGMSTGQAMRWSLYAATANIGTMIVYGFALLGLIIVGMLPYAIGMIVVIPVAAISTYVGYREVFEPA